MTTDATRRGVVDDSSTDAVDGDDSGDWRTEIDEPSTSAGSQASRAEEGDVLADLGFGEGEVRDLLDGLPETPQLRPALQKLTGDQLGLLRRFIDGFENRRTFLLWCQDAAIHTLGRLDGDWMVERAFSRLDLSVLLVSRRRFAWADTDDDGNPKILDAESAATARRGVAAVDLLPAFVASHRGFRWSATEYVEDDRTETDEGPPDPEEQDAPGMRPALAELDQRQDWALRQVLDGFESEDQMLAWVQQVTEASYAEVPDDLATRLYTESHTREMLLDREGERARSWFFRESFAAKEILPAFAVAAREVADRSGELAERENSELPVRNL
ncbi:hypothetical protein [Halorussus lipolyticus]|uniref:hypothetical protein n=1 Tax=Halorussus lipolyticus TaxID=3034024 RepID=UPI0023E7597D|nr:hypothetical protein [Halorussus sp. DT80]